MARGLNQQKAARNRLARAGEHPAALALHRVPGKAADPRQFQTAIGLDFLDHRAQGVHVASQRPGCVLGLAHQRCSQRTLAGVSMRKAQIVQIGDHTIHGSPGKPGRAGDVQKIDENVTQIVFVNGWQRHGELLG